MNLKNVIKLWKAMLQLSEIATDKAKLIVEDTLAEGVEVFVEDENGEQVQEHLYAKTLFIGGNDSIDNYIEVAQEV